METAKVNDLGNTDLIHLIDNIMEGKVDPDKNLDQVTITDPRDTRDDRPISETENQDTNVKVDDDTIPQDTSVLSDTESGLESDQTRPEDQEANTSADNPDEVTEPTDPNDEADDGSTPDSETDPEDTEEDVKDSSEETPTEDADVETSDETVPDIDMAEYEKFKTFYEEATADFKASGKKRKGLKNGQDVIKMQQKAIGYDKLAQKVAPLKPFLKAMEDSGLHSNPEQMNLMLQILKGDKQAIKRHLNSLDLDPLTFVKDDDEEDTPYELPDNAESDVSIKFDEYRDTLDNMGKLEVFDNEVLQSWDNNSISELMYDDTLRQHFTDHITHGIYEHVAELVEQKVRTDVTGVYSEKSSLDQYKEAAEDYLEIVRKEKANKPKPKKQTKPKTQTKIVEKKKPTIDEKIEKAKKAATATPSNQSTKIVDTKQEASPDNISHDDLMDIMKNLAG